MTDTSAPAAPASPSETRPTGAGSALLAPQPEAAESFVQDPSASSRDAEIQAAIDGGFDPPADPTGYRFETPPGAEPLPLGHMKLFGETMHQLGLPAGMGSQLVAEFWRADRENGGKPLDEAAQEMTARRGIAELERRHGPEQAAKMIEAARGIVAPLIERDRRFKELLEQTGLCNSPWLIESLANLAAAQAAKPRRA